MTTPTYSEMLAILQACYAALNSAKRFPIIGEHPCKDSYALASVVNAFMDRMIKAHALESAERPTEEAAYHLEVVLCGMTPVGPDALTLADDIADVTEWDLGLRLVLPDKGIVEPLIERSFASWAEADEAATALLELFPMASFEQLPD